MPGEGQRMTKDNWIYTYYQGIKNGKYTVGRWIELVYEYIIKGLEEKQFFFDGKKAAEAIDWMESHCFHTEGPLAPNKIELEIWQKAFISCIYGLVDKNGLRQFREIFLVVGRKNGKTKLASSLGAYEFRSQEYGSRVFCIAPKLEQADLVYNDVWQMTTLDPEYKKLKEYCSEKNAQRLKIHDDSELPRHRQSDLSVPATNSTVKKIAFSAKKSDGFNPSLCICDEIASWEGDAGLKQYEVMKSGMGARPEGILISCTTSGYINDSIYDEMLKRATRFLLGDSKERKLLPFLYMIDDVGKWNDINELRKSNPNLGISVSVDYMLEEIAVAEGSLSKKSEFICKYANLKQASSLAWIDAQTIEATTGEPLDPQDFRGCYAVAGFDLSRTTDLTAACVVIEKDGELYVLAKFFLPEERIVEAQSADGVPYGLYVQRGLLQPSGSNIVDYNDVFNWFRTLVEEYEIFPLKVGYDKYSANYLVQQMDQYGFHMDDVYQGYNLHPVIQEVEGLLKDNKIHIGDNDLLKIHFFNSALKISTEKGKSKLIKIKPAAHIDGMAALLDAMTVRQKWYGEIGDQLRNED
jgi:phage terminase large subunit-like protein